MLFAKTTSLIKSANSGLPELTDCVVWPPEYDWDKVETHDPLDVGARVWKDDTLMADEAALSIFWAFKMLAEFDVLQGLTSDR